MNSLQSHMITPGLGEMGEISLVTPQIPSGWSAPSSQTHTPAPAAVPPHVYSPMSFDQMSDRELLDMIQGAAASIQAVQDQLNHMSLTRSTAPPPPPPPVTTTATNPPPAPIPSNSDLKFAKPNKFNGSSRGLGSPIQGKEGVQGEAVPLLEDIDTFWAEFTKHYVDTNRDEKYRQKWNNLRQKGSVQEYTREFQQYSVSLGYSDETLRDKYYDGLKNEIKDIMLSTMFQWRRATAQQVYDKAEEIANHIESTRLSHPSVPSSTTRVPSNSTSQSTPISSPTRTRLNVGDNVYMIDPPLAAPRKVPSLQLFVPPLAICPTLDGMGKQRIQ
ncbi:hypothetical protein RHS01_06731 [Rhizoctonia solani]|uniref:Retrotransposon gag domain-containing protein n=1 Tax=Rhizoctonia solani TaxID=456999 RepID=A0A8H7IEK7_9AGAM|nr:hypothetical protein RHS01_06731 [Rhizoctonia solani]